MENDLGRLHFLADSRVLNDLRFIEEIPNHVDQKFMSTPRVLDLKSKVSNFIVDFDNHVDANIRKVDNTSCNGLCSESTESSNYPSASSAENKLKLAIFKKEQLTSQLELEEQLRRQKNAIRLQKIKYELMVTQVMVEAEKEKEKQGTLDVPVTSKLDTLNKFLADCKLSVGKAEPIPQTNIEKFGGFGSHIVERQSVDVGSRPFRVASHNPGPPYVERRNYVKFYTAPTQAHLYQFEMPKAESTPFLAMSLTIGDL